MKLFNSLSRQMEEFVPIDDGKVGMYTCGPTVYSYVTIGNWRTYVLGDLLARTLGYLGYEVDYVMNITDVGHLTGDNVGDADTGEDRLEKAAKKEGRTAWDIARFYADDFYQGYRKLNMVEPKLWCKATDHIPEQIDMVKRIMDQGMAYQITDGIYFDTKAFEAAGNVYGELSTLNQIREGARVEPNLEKRDPRDFALWKFSPKREKRQMEWDSPWGMGFPGWHIECSAMSQKYLGNQFEIHVGGEDLRSTHHPNEIAQAEAATGKKPFVKYWVHGAFLLVDGGRMGKSLGNAYTLEDLEAKGFSPMDLRYIYLTGHYRKQLNFTWEGLKAAKKSLHIMRDIVMKFGVNETERTVLSEEKLDKIDDYRHRFRAAIEDDLNMPEVLAIVWETAKSSVPSKDKYDLLMEFDRVLGLGMELWEENEVIPVEILTFSDQRLAARKRGDFETADSLRDKIREMGYEIEDLSDSVRIKKKEAYVGKKKL
jgi:cysteinyl-tRNA synthetase